MLSWDQVGTVVLNNRKYVYTRNQGSVRKVHGLFVRLRAFRRQTLWGSLPAVSLSDLVGLLQEASPSSFLLTAASDS